MQIGVGRVLAHHGVVDEADRSELDRLRGWPPAGHSAPDPRSGPALHGRLSKDAESPNLNACAERFVLSIKSECLNRIVAIGERHLRLAVTEYAEHYHAERHHQGLGNRLIAPGPGETISAGDVKRRERLGGLLNCYHREAA